MLTKKRLEEIGYGSVRQSAEEGVEMARALLGSNVMEWVDVKTRMPIDVATVTKFESISVIVTDGNTVGICDCQAGATLKPWVAFSRYGDIHPDCITHFMYPPSLPR